MVTSKGGQKYALIIGCTPGGIGYALATEFQDRGFHVIATARKESLLDDLRSKGMSALQLDVTSERSIAECRSQVEQITGGKLDILINNAGRGGVCAATDIDLADARLMYETNVFGMMAMVRSFIKLLIPTQGLIINVASVSALVPYVFGSVYASSKAAVMSYSRTLRQELRPFGVRVQVAMAGTVKSNIGVAAGAYLPEDSLYQRIRHTFEIRTGYSQKEEASPMPTEVFVKRLVDNALKSEVPFSLRTWFGRSDWFYEGGLARMLYWGSLLPEWVLDNVIWRRFKLYELEAMVKEDRSAERTKLD
ncbi:MAG: hypothetical protein Q9170_004789 [Blastenia crenularia]